MNARARDSLLAKIDKPCDRHQFQRRTGKHRRESVDADEERRVIRSGQEEIAGEVVEGRPVLFEPPFRVPKHGRGSNEDRPRSVHESGIGFASSELC